MSEGPWGQPVIDKQAERQKRVNTAMSEIEAQVRSNPETARLQYLLTKKNTPPEHMTLEEGTGDIRLALSVIQSTIAELNSEFSRLGFDVVAKVEYIPKTGM